MPREIDSIIRKYPEIRHGDLYVAEQRTKTLRRLSPNEIESLPRILSSQRVLIKPGSNDFWRLVQQGWKIQNPYMGFRKLAQELEKRGAKSSKALAAWIGRKKYGKKVFQKMAEIGRRAAEKNPVKRITLEYSYASSPHGSEMYRGSMNLTQWFYQSRIMESEIRNRLFAFGNLLDSYRILFDGKEIAYVKLGPPYSPTDSKGRFKEWKREAIEPELKEQMKTMRQLIAQEDE